MRWVAALSVLALLLAPALAGADPEDELAGAPAASLSSQVDRFHVGADTHWSADSLDDRLGLGLGWRVPRRWYDADGALLTERSLLHPGRDLERPGLYVALRF